MIEQSRRSGSYECLVLTRRTLDKPYVGVGLAAGERGDDALLTDRVQAVEQLRLDETLRALGARDAVDVVAVVAAVKRLQRDLPERHQVDAVGE